MFDLRIGDAAEVLRAVPDDSVQCCVTSPPYWGLRDYGADGMIGLESSFSEYLERLLAVFREVRRVLKPDGVAWVNMGDCYTQSGRGSFGERSQLSGSHRAHDQSRKALARVGRLAIDELPRKQLIGQPWRVAFALQADGWWLRQEVIWEKPNAMPESVTDRPARSHEQVFLLSKQVKYFYDAEAIKERVTGGAHPRGHGVNPKAGKNESAAAIEAKPRNRPGQAGFNARWKSKQNASFSAAVAGLVEMRNARSVWRIATQPCKHEHFAAFPEELARRCILAGSRPGDTVLDPFAGTCTTGAAALGLGRRFLGCEINPDFAEMGRARSRVNLGLGLVAS